LICPLVAPKGTVAVIEVGELMVNDPALTPPPNFTSVTVDRLVPVIVTLEPTTPLVGVKPVITGEPVTLKLFVEVPVPSIVVTEIFTAPTAAVAGTVATI
jgi:hypothetical protein